MKKKFPYETCLPFVIVVCAGVLDAVAVAAVVPLVVDVAEAVALTVRISCVSIRSRHSAT